MGLGAVAGLLVGSLAFVVDGDPDQTSQINDSLATGEQAVTDLNELVNPTTLPETATAEPVPTVDHVVTTTTISPPPGTSVDTTTTIQLPTEPVDYLAVGDSVMLGAAPSLTQRGLFVDAAVSRQMIDVIPVFEQLRDRHLLGTAVVVHLGNNGPISEATLDAFLATMNDVPNVILLTVKADRSWTADNNALLRAADHEGDNKILLDWEVRSAECPGECFYDDGIHLRPEGQQYYANLISDILGI